MTKRPGNSKFVKKMNRLSVLNIIKEHEPVSRNQLAKMTGLTPPAITGIIRELIAAGFVQEVGLGASNGGRRPMGLKFNGEAAYVIGVEMTHFESIVGFSDLKDHPTGLFPVRIDMTEPFEGTKVLIDTIRRLMNAHPDKSFLGLGIAFPGLLNVQGGIIKRAVNLGPKWSGFPFKRILEEQLGLQVCMESNAKAAALAERWFGGGTECHTLAYINLGEGISTGVILNDALVHGSRGYAGQIGHINISDDGPLCNCGNRGCLEAFCGIPALERQAARLLEEPSAHNDILAALVQKEGMSIAALIRAADSGSPAARSLFAMVGHHLGIAVASLINMYNPEAVFIGGKTAAAGRHFIDIVRNVACTHAFPEIAASTRIDISSLQHYPGVIGACAMAMNDLLSSFSPVLLGDTEQERRTEAAASARD